jgi:PAS domain S-box-containing protein
LVLHTRKLVLESQGFSVETATSGKEGLRLFHSGKTAAVVLDYDMPDMNGIEVAAFLRQQVRQLPIVMLSAFPSLPDEAKGLVDAFVRKGETPDVLMNTLASLIRVRSHRHPELDGDYVAFADGNGRYVDVSDRICELLGYCRAELVGKHIRDVTAPMTADVERMFSEYTKAGDQQGIYVLLSRAGKQVVIHYRAHSFEDGCLAAVWHPLEPQRKAAEAMKRREVLPKDESANGGLLTAVQ